MSVYKLVVAILSVFSILILGVSLFLDPASEISQLIDYYDLVLCMVFLYDFVRQLSTADKKLKYFFTYGWIDLISSIPMVGIFRVARVFRILRVVRVFKSIKILISFLRSNRKDSLYGLLVLFICFVVVISSVLTLYFEQATGNIKTAEDALWWTFISVTTVGYGDHYPVTGYGRLSATAMIFSGLLAFGTVVSFLNDKLNSFK